MKKVLLIVALAMAACTPPPENQIKEVKRLVGGLSYYDQKNGMWRTNPSRAYAEDGTYCDLNGTFVVGQFLGCADGWKSAEATK